MSLWAVTQQFNTTTSMGRLTLNVLLSFAQFEREIAGERIRDKIAASKKKGLWMGGNVPLGYEVKNRALIINEAEAKKVRLIFSRYLALGSVHTLAEELDRKIIRSQRRVTQSGKTIGGCPLTRGHLYLILKNPLYLGMVVHKGRTYPGLHKPIIERKTWERVQEQLAGNRTDHRTQRRARVPSLLTGLLFDSAGETNDAVTRAEGWTALPLLHCAIIGAREGPGRCTEPAVAHPGRRDRGRRCRSAEVLS